MASLTVHANDTLSLAAGYSNETATVTHDGMTVDGGATSTGIVLQLQIGIATFTLTGAAPINVLDAADGNGIVGNAGNNVITVTAGADAVSGGLGTDRLIVDYHLGTTAVTGDSTTNFHDGSGRLVTINGGFENFTVLTGSGADTLTVGDGANVINAGDGANTITAGNGANSITSGSGTDTITAGNGGNFINAGDGANTITSGSGNDTIISGVGAATIVAGGGNDAITVHGGGAATVHSGAGVDRLVVDYTAFNTAVTGGITGGNLATGYTGHIADLSGNTADFDATENLTILTGAGADTLTVGDGANVINAGDGANTITAGQGANIITTGSGADTIVAGNGGNFINAGDGANNITSGSGNDTIISGVGAAHIVAGGGNDVVVVHGGAGTVDSGAGVDRLIVDYSAFNAPVTAGLSGGSLLAGYSGHIGDMAGNTTDFAGTESFTITTGGGNDVLLVGAGDDVLHGGGGNDKLYGMLGNDWLYGDNGKDLMRGGAGNDHLFGGYGNDILIGGPGRDYFVFDTALNATSNVDRILDFHHLADQIDLSHAIFQAAGHIGHLAAAAFFQGTAAHDASDRIIYNPTNGFLTYDSNGSLPGGVHHFATLAANLHLNSLDFMVVA